MDRGIPMARALELVEWAVERAYYPPRPIVVVKVRKRRKAHGSN
jgi:hypothetical protein